VEIAKLTGKRHDHVMRDIRLIANRLEDSPNLGGEIVESEYKAGNGKLEVCYQLDSEAALLVVTGYDDVARAKVIARLKYLEQKQLAKEEQAKVRADMRLDFHPMTDAIVAAREGKTLESHHFSTECDLINRIVLGATAKQYRKMFDIDESEPLRDLLSAEQQKAVLLLRRANTVYLLEGLDFQERKLRLQALHTKCSANQLVAEVFNEA
jgi:phage regulator Rha-like protein